MNVEDRRTVTCETCKWYGDYSKTSEGKICFNPKSKHVGEWVSKYFCCNEHRWKYD